MTNKSSPQLESSELVPQSSVELTYPIIPLPAYLVDLVSLSVSTNMSHESQSDYQDTTLSESWATLSDADYSFDDDLQSETTDAASLLDNTGPEDVHSIADRSSDVGSQDGYGDRDVSQPPHRQGYPAESTRVADTEGVGAFEASHLAHTIELEPTESKTETEWSEVKRTIYLFNGKEVNRIMGQDWSRDEHSQYIGSVCMTISKSRLKLDRPFRLLYIGNMSARAEILTKVGDVLVSGSEAQRAGRQQGSANHEVVLPSHGSESLTKPPDLTKIDTGVIVNDCVTATSIRHNQSPDQIFLGFKNGSLHSSWWADKAYKISSGSGWAAPDLAIFFVAHDDHPALKRRQQLAHTFACRHQIPRLVICEDTSYAARFSDLLTDHRTPHLRIEDRKDRALEPTPTLSYLPIDLETFVRLDSEQLNKNFAFLSKGGSDDLTGNTSGHSSPPTHAIRHETPPSKRGACDETPSMAVELCAWGLNNQFLAAIALTVSGLISLTVGLVAYNATLALSMQFLSRAGGVSDMSLAPAWSLQPLSTATMSGKALSVIETAGVAVVTSNSAVPKSLATMDMPSDFAELMTSKSVPTINKSEDFQVHGIGDCHIVIQTPRGFKVRNKSVPFDVVVARGGHVLDSSFSKLFDGVYTIRVDRAEAYGLLNVTIRRHKSSMMEEHQVDFGAQWLKVAGWKKAAQVASEHVRTDLDTAQAALSAAYGQLSGDVQFKARHLSRRATWQAKKFSQQSRLFVESTAKLLSAKSDQLRHATNHERQEAYQLLSTRVDLALRALLVYAHTMNERGRAVVENILTSVGQAAEQIQQNAPHVDVVDIQNKMQDYLRSERLAKAQERAKWIVKDTSTSWRQRKAARSAKRTGCVKEAMRRI